MLLRAELTSVAFAQSPSPSPTAFRRGWTRPTRLRRLSSLLRPMMRRLLRSVRARTSLGAFTLTAPIAQNGNTPSRPTSASPGGRLTRSAITRAATRSPSPGPGKPRAATTASKRATRAPSSSATSTPKANGIVAPSTQPTPASRTPRASASKLPSASQPLPTTRLGARSASQMKSLSQLDTLASTPKSARATRSRTAPTQAPSTVPNKGTKKWLRGKGESSDEESSSSEKEEEEVMRTRSGVRASGSVPPAKSRKSLW